MTRRQWLRRRLLWVAVVLGLLLLFGTVELLRAALAGGDALRRIASAAGERRRRLAY